MERTQTEVAMKVEGDLPTKIRTALISVSNRTGLVELARFLRHRGVRLIATSGTAEYLDENSIDVYKVESLTGFGRLWEEG